jgi:hypothetical protein
VQLEMRERAHGNRLLWLCRTKWATSGRQYFVVARLLDRRQLLEVIRMDLDRQGPLREDLTRVGDVDVQERVVIGVDANVDDEREQLFALLDLPHQHVERELIDLDLEARGNTVLLGAKQLVNHPPAIPKHVDKCLRILLAVQLRRQVDEKREDELLTIALATEFS